ncbi:putative integral membrane transmembrane protein [Hyalangium minutum]|uniref:Probable membrane transporter protein n=2 Tax=Hyalangium minutum TaxID=394096 RepID=A0A085WIN9_9BACT|nr:putative integral membrane transmembrane protein [Hyalangium minutum]
MLLAGAGFLAGAMNALAGGGSFVTLPALMLVGVPSVSANASSTVALLPGSLASTWAYRADLTAMGGVSLRALMGVSLAGGFVGALLLLLTPLSVFNAFIPWLLLLATLVFVFGPRAGQVLRRTRRIGAGPVLMAQFLLAVYGGYFGGAVGIMMMAVWSLLSPAELTTLNPAKTLLVAATNAVAVVCFIAAGKVWWPQTLALLFAAMWGGYLGARAARYWAPRRLRMGVSILSALITLAYFLRAP